MGENVEMWTCIFFYSLRKSLVYFIYLFEFKALQLKNAIKGQCTIEKQEIEK
jgi:hypothetical protein